MNKVKSDLFKRIKNKKKILYGFIAILWIVLTIFVFNILRHPIEALKETNENNIVQETTFSYKADMLPFSLNPNGEIIDIKEGAFTKVTKNIILHITTFIKTDNPVSLSGTKKVILKLVAEDLWEKEYVLDRETSFKIDGTDNKIIDSDYIINIGELTSFMTMVEEEIGTRPGKYIFEIKPIINGTIMYNGQEIPIDQDAQTFIDYSQTQIKVSGENKFTKTVPVTTNFIISQRLNILGMEIPMKIAKYLFGSIYSIISIILVTMAVHYLKTNKLSLSESQIIDKKYHVRLINVMQEVDKLDKDKVVLDSFKSLLKISDEREAPIFSYKGHDKVVYYVMDEGYIFIYKIDNNLEENLDLQINLIS